MNHLLEPHWITVIALALSFLANLVLLGYFIGRADRQAMRLAEANRVAQQDLLHEFERLINEAESSRRDRFDDLRRVLGRLELKDAAQSTSVPTPAPSQATHARPGYGGLDKKRHVLALANRGLDSSGIARRLNMYEGEADLVLGLRQFVAGAGRGDQPPRS